MANVKRLNITSVVAGYSGTNRNGNAFTIYDVEAAGNTHKLRSFDKLPLGENDYEIEPYSKDGTTTYTLKPSGFRVPRDPDQAGGGGAAGDIQEIKNRLGRLEQKVFGTEPASDVTPPAGDDDWPSAGIGTATDDDIPF